MKNYIFALVLTLSYSVAQAQGHFPARYRYTSIGAELNAMNYVGDLDPASNFISPSLRFTRWHLGGHIDHRFAPRLHVRGSFSYGRIQGDDGVSSGTSGDDKFRNTRNLSFRNDIFEVKADLVYDFFLNRRGFQRRLQYTPYAFVGIAGIYHNPKTQYDGEWVSLRDVGTEGQNIDGVGQDKQYSLIQPTIPFGIGIRYKLSKILDISFEIGWRWTFTDYLDDVGGDYVDKQNFEYGSTGYWLSDRSITPEMAQQFENMSATELNNIGVYRVNDGTNNHYYKPGYGRGENSIDENRGDVGNDNDWYIVTGIHLNYIFHPRISCPKFRG